MIKAVVFDCFGVLLTNGWNVFLSNYETAEISDDLKYLNLRCDRGDISYDDFLVRVNKLTNVTTKDIDNIITKSLVLNQPLITYIKDLKLRGYKVSIITNVGGPISSYLTDEVINLFERITESHDVHMLKPDPGIYLKHLEILNVKPIEAVFIDDAIANCEGARAVGMEVIHYTNLIELKNELSKLLK